MLQKTIRYLIIIWKKNLPELFTILNYDRATLITNLQNINEEQFKRTGKHLKFGTLNIAQWTDMFLLHEAHHLWTMFGLINTSSSFCNGY